MLHYRAFSTTELTHIPPPLSPVHPWMGLASQYEAFPFSFALSFLIKQYLFIHETATTAATAAARTRSNRKTRVEVMGMEMGMGAAVE